MTFEQLEVLAKLMRGDKKSLAYQAAKLVLVDGMSQVDTANVLEAKTNTVNNGVTRYRNAHEEIKKVYLMDN
ncbi:hypothetical protein [Pseudoalteromonas marina]|uniref:TrfB transcriptional repressor protein domain-containing protein n=1 Tax=Pseudoalteromonas marina TaxID=267375 RepID=A0ABT9FIX1_9GAMM|nr:hypothetical protein [Pseudoalteromonas marina]MDP2566436.1 hypothetical protein [Pseudoalteromonas marina]